MTTMDDGDAWLAREARADLLRVLDIVEARDRDGDDRAMHDWTITPSRAAFLRTLLLAESAAPREPTEAMIAAGLAVPYDERTCHGATFVAAQYRAMVAAAPLSAAVGREPTV